MKPSDWPGRIGRTQQPAMGYTLCDAVINPKNPKKDPSSLKIVPDLGSISSLFEIYVTWVGELSWNNAGAPQILDLYFCSHVYFNKVIVSKLVADTAVKTSQRQ